jgi:nicotinamidase-related amidase
MTTLTNRQKVALVIIDVQNGVVERAHERDAVITNIGILLSRARTDLINVVWVQHSDEQLPKGSDDWNIAPELTPGPSLTRTTETHSKMRILKRCCPASVSESSSLLVHKPMDVSFAGTT